ncbi:MAG: hypothetical protein PVI11_07610 [Candidatus Aminicenantes bacterium]|jgi:TM2 domain-containing membrane protein YozV
MKLELIFIALLLVVVFLVQPPVLSAQAKMKGDPDYKEPFVAFILSFLIPGLGQIYVGDMNRGLIFLGIWVGLWVVSWALFYATLGVSFFIAPLVTLAFAVYAGIDAMNLAKKHNAGGGPIALLEKIRPNSAPIIVVTR